MFNKGNQKLLRQRSGQELWMFAKKRTCFIAFGTWFEYCAINNAQKLLIDQRLLYVIKWFCDKFIQLIAPGTYVVRTVKYSF